MAKSWFILAQVRATIAGFLVVSSGLSLTYKSSMISTVANEVGNLGAKYSITFQSPNWFENFFIANGFIALFISGIALGILSIIFCFVGRHELGKAKRK